MLAHHIPYSGSMGSAQLRNKNCSASSHKHEPEPIGKFSMQKMKLWAQVKIFFKELTEEVTSRTHWH